jgi:hypothetical protein
MKKLLLTTAITLGSFITPAHASSMTADALAAVCIGNIPNIEKEKDWKERAAWCNSYLMGWDDARYAFLKGTTTFCPHEVSYKDMSIVFYDYLVAHKEARKLPAAEALMLAFKAYWPCH